MTSDSRTLLSAFEPFLTSSEVRGHLARLFAKIQSMEAGEGALEVAFEGGFRMRCAPPASVIAPDLPPSLARFAALHNGMELERPHDVPLVLPALDEEGRLQGVDEEWLEGADSDDDFDPEQLSVAFFDGQDLAILRRDEIGETGEPALYHIDHGACCPEAVWDDLTIPEAFLLKVAEAVLEEEILGTFTPSAASIRIGEETYSSRAVEIRIHGEDLDVLPATLGDFPRLRTLVILTRGELRTLPEMVGQLRNLRELTVAAPCLETLPATLAKLENLKELRLSSERWEVVPDFLDELRNLEKLKLEGPFARLPESLGRLQNLKELELEGPALEALPESIGELRALEELFVKGAALKGLPEGLGGLPHLRRLALISLRHLESLPESLGRLKALEELILNGCSALCTLPAGLGGLKTLRSLGALRTGLGDEAWPVICSVRGLTSLELSGSRFTEVPETLGRLKQLRTFSLCGSCLPRFPEVVAALKHLQYLSLGSRGQALQLPESFGGLRELRRLHLHGWSMTELPDVVFRLHLGSLYLEDCADLERLPASFGKAAATLETLNISECPCLTHLPEDLTNCRKLDELTLHRTGIGWNVARQIRPMKSLRVFRLSGARLGPRPEDVRDFEALIGEEDGISYDLYGGSNVKWNRSCDLARQVLKEEEREEPDFPGSVQLLEQILVHWPEDSFWGHYLQHLDKLVNTFGRLPRETWPAFHPFLHAVLDAVPHLGGVWEQKENLLGNLIAAMLATADPERDARIVRLRALVRPPIQNENLAFNLACACALMKDRDGLLEYARVARALGRERKVFLQDADLQAYWEDPEFLALLD